MSAADPYVLPPLFFPPSEEQILKEELKAYKEAINRLAYELALVYEVVPNAAQFIDTNQKGFWNNPLAADKFKEAHRRAVQRMGPA